MSKKVTDIFEDYKFLNNPYSGRDKKGYATRTSQTPKRMHKEKKLDDPTKPHELNADDFDALLVPPELRNQSLKESQRKKDHKSGISLRYRHRYGDDIDILRTVFTKSREELEKEKFKLILVVRTLFKVIFFALRDIPPIEKYRLGDDVRKIVYGLLKDSIAIKKRYYRRNILESMDIELETLREILRFCHIQYPDWMTDDVINSCWEAINDVAAIVGGLLKTSVC